MNLTNLMQHIIQDSFPELSAGAIEIYYKKIKGAYLDCRRVQQNSYKIRVHRNLNDAPRQVLVGGIAHELAHFYRDFQRDDLMHFCDLFLYNRFSTYQTYDERATDRLVIERGKGEELLAFLRYANKKRKKYSKKDGLTVKKIIRK